MKNSIDLQIKLHKADIELKTIVVPFYDAREELGGDNKHERMTFIEIKGSIKDIVKGCDLIICNDDEIDLSNFNSSSPKVAKDIVIRIKMVENNSLLLYKEPHVEVHEGDFYVNDLYFGVDQFNQIKATLEESFVRIDLSISRLLTKDEISTNLANDDFFIPYYYDYDEIDYSYLSIIEDGENREVLHLKDKHNGYGVKITNFTIKSSKPKYIKESDWVDDVWSLEIKLEEQQFNNEKSWIDGVNTEANNYPKHIFNELKKVSTLAYVIIILLIILIFKV